MNARLLEDVALVVLIGLGFVLSVLWVIGLIALAEAIA